MIKFIKIVLIGSLLMYAFPSFVYPAKTYNYVITHYCSCKVCCGKNAKGLTASGKAVKEGMIACNHLSFGAKVLIKGKIYIVEDRGAKRYFGDFKHIKRHVDIYVSNHEEAKKKGVYRTEVTIL